MKKCILIFLALTLFIALGQTVACAALQQKDTEAMPSFNLPASIQFIEDEAFEGTVFAGPGLGIQSKEDQDALDGPEHETQNIDSIASREIKSQTVNIAAKIPGVFILPKSLAVIGDEAFEGVPAEWVKLPETLREIGDRAFADNPELRAVMIPDSVIRIGADVFSGNQRVMIAASSGSYARTWAEKNGIAFTPGVALYAGTGTQTVIAGLNSGLSFSPISPLPEEVYYGAFISTGRPVEEIQASWLQEPAAYHVSGRSPPESGMQKS